MQTTHLDHTLSAVHIASLPPRFGRQNMSQSGVIEPRKAAIFVI